MATTSFRHLYDHPPRGTIQDTHADIRTTGDFHHDLGSTLTPNEIVDAPGLAGDLIRWAQGYLNRIQHAPGSQLVHLAASTSNQLGRSQSGNEGTITSLYARTIETWSSEFVASADNVPLEAIRFEECGQVNGVRSDWKWTRNDKTRMIVEHKGREVFNNYCHQIRSLATSNASLGFGNSGSITGASSILTKLGVQMIAKDCQFGVIFGGQQFILLAMVDEHRNGCLVHQMRCSNILPTIPAPGNSLPGAFQITIAALLGPKHAFFNARGINYGLVQVLPEGRPPTREAAKKGKSISESSRKGKGRMQTTQAFSGTSRQVIVSYYGCPESRRLYTRVDKSKSVPRPSPGDATGELVLYNTIGGSFSGAIIDADLHQSGEAMQIVAKSYDPDTKALQENESEPDVTSETTEAPTEEGRVCQPDTEGEPSCLPLPNEDKEYAFWGEVEAYNRLSDTCTCPRFYGALRGTHNTGYQTGIILLEKLPTIFGSISEMTDIEKKIAYDHVLELHRRGIHHGDVRGGNIGRRESISSANTGSKRKRSKKQRQQSHRNALVIFDFSHSEVFEECDPEQCQEIRIARERLLEGKPE